MVARWYVFAKIAENMCFADMKTYFEGKIKIQFFFPKILKFFISFLNYIVPVNPGKMRSKSRKNAPKTGFSGNGGFEVRFLIARLDFFLPRTIVLWGRCEC